ncbi:hypothetical protein yc1106_09484 [Curvularia clavata]|uniref:BTB domain-containing protein n=1 Tax=Curvularia clavata TaxID=95742 RepID=A0A9Q9DXQ6_CURCL|nr:hypothetical protein yc1106_09484 [Curvularia clavata]
MNADTVQNRRPEVRWSFTMQQDYEASSSIASDRDHIVLLDSRGDAVLKCVGQDGNVETMFRVSTAILRLASSVFSNMFKPSFQEGQRLVNEDCPEFELEDDAHLMGLLLKILHYRGSRSDYTIDAEQLARLSLLCDKYDFTEALGPWIPTWFRHSEKLGHLTHSLGFLVLAAYMFNDAMEFKAASQRAVLQLTPKFSAEWEKEDLLSILPLRIIGTLQGVGFTVLSLRLFRIAV